MKDKKINFVLESLSNVAFSELKQVSDKLSLLNHRILHFDKSPFSVKVQVIEELITEIRERIKISTDFWSEQDINDLRLLQKEYRALDRC